jgi:hypothetical protein
MKIAAATAVMALGAGAASAATVLSLSEEPSPGIQQSDQGPCVIGDNSCNSNDTPLIGFTLLPNTNPPGVPDEYDVDSPIYTVAALRSYLDPNDAFDIGIDINNNGNDAADFAHRLFSFTMSLVGGGVLFEYAANPGTALGDANNPGLGFSDFRLSGFSLAGLDDDDEVFFSLFMDDVDAGRDQFFLIKQDPNVIPLPAAGWLLIAGLGGLAAVKRRKRAA